MSIKVPWWIASPVLAAIGIGLIIAAALGKWDGAAVAIGAGGGAVAAAIWAAIRGLSGSLSGSVTTSSGEVTVSYALKDLDFWVMTGALVVGIIVGVVINFAA